MSLSRDAFAWVPGRHSSYLDWLVLKVRGWLVRCVLRGESSRAWPRGEVESTGSGARLQRTSAH